MSRYVMLSCACAVGHNNTKVLPSLVGQKVRSRRAREETEDARMGIARRIE